MSLFRHILGEDSEVTRFRVWAGILVIWAVCGVLSCEEIKYATKGQTATAELVNKSYNSIKGESNLTYRWQDAKTGEYRKKVISYRGSNAPQQIQMRYIPGGLRSRPVGSGTMIPPILFGIMTVVAVGWFVINSIRNTRR